MPMTTLLSMSTVASELRRAPRGANLDLLWQRLEQVKLSGPKPPIATEAL